MALHCFSTSRTIRAPLDRVWRAWADPGEWSSWIGMTMRTSFRCGGRFDNGHGEGGEYLAIERPRLIRFTWEMHGYEPGSFVEVRFSERGPGRTECELRHLQLHTVQNCEDAHRAWSSAMDSLQAWVERDPSMTREAWGARSGSRVGAREAVAG
jgi:uncharacterized protein YndB with AHSA1/START domain